MAEKIIAWSFSALEQFRNCPRQYQAEKVTKEVPYKETPQTKQGKWLHKMFEDYLGKNRALPPELLEFKPMLDRLKQTWPNVQAERKLAINAKFEPVEYFAKDTWCRGQVDAWSIDGELCRVADWKTGKRKYDYDQLLLMALLTMCTFPQVQRVKAGFFWTQEKAFDVEEFHRKDWHSHWERFLPDVTRLQRAMDLNVWQEQPSGLCNGWCPVQTCAYWKPKREKH